MKIRILLSLALLGIPAAYGQGIPYALPYFSTVNTIAAIPLPGSPGTYCLNYATLLGAPTLVACPGTGAVSSFSFTNGNGFLGTVTNPTTTPALSLNLSLTGDCSFSAGVITCTETNGTAFGALATTVPGAGVATFLAAPTATNLGAAVTGASIVGGTGISVSGTWPNQTVTATGGGGATFQQNGTNLSNQTTINFENSAATNGLTLEFLNPSLGNVQLALTGTLTNAGLANSSVTLNGQSVSLGSSGNVNNGAPQYSIALNGAAGAAIGGIALPGTTGTYCIDYSSLTANPTFITCPGAGGGLSSVGLSTTASWFTIGNSPLTVNGTITMNPTTGLTANEGLFTPNGTTGAVGLRAMVAADLPASITSNTSGSAGSLSGSITLANTPLTTLGDILYVNSTPALARLAGNTTSSAEVLTQTGTGSVSAAPAWSSAPAISGANLSALPTSTGLYPILNQNTTGTAANITATSNSTLTTLSALSLPSTQVTGLGTFATQNYATPPAIGGTTPAAGSFTTLSASSTVSGSGFSTYLASPPAIGGTTAAAGAFTTLSASSTVSGSGFSTYLASPPAIGGTTAAAAHFTTIGATGQITSTLATGTAPFSVTSTTPVTNLNIGGNAATATALSTTGSNGTFWGVSGGVQGYYTPSGSGTVTDGSGTTTIGALMYSSTTAHAYSLLASPTSGAGIYIPRYDATSTSAVAPTADQVGVGTRSLSGSASTDTALYSDVLGIQVHDIAATASITDTVPTPTSLGNAHFSSNWCNDSTHTDTISPTTYTIGLNGGAAASTASVLSGQCVMYFPDPFNSTQWDAFTYGLPNPINLASSGAGGVTGILPVANGGTGTASPGLVAGTNVTITGSWPNQTINASGGGGSPSTPAFSVQYDNAGSFGGVSLTAGTLLQGTGTGAAPTATATPTLGASGTLGSLTFGNATSGTLTIEPVTGALGTVTAQFPANSGTVAETNFGQTFASTQVFSGIINPSLTPGASQSAINITGSPYTGGSTTTNFPLVYFKQGATAPTTFSANGTEFGMNAPSGFTGNLESYFVNGGTAVWTLTYQGNVTGGTYNGSTVPTSAGTLPGSTGTFTLNDCLEVGSTSPLEIKDTGSGCGSGSGGVTSFSGDGALLSNSSSTGAVTATLANTGVGYGVWGNTGSSSGAPGYHALSSYPTAAFPTLNQSTTGNAATVTTAASTTNSAFSILTASATSGSQAPATVASFTINPSTGAVNIPGALTVSSCTGCGSGSSAFSSLTGGTNTSAAMLVGSGASLGPTGTGTLNANEVNGAAPATSAAVAATNSSGQIIAATTATYLVDTGTTFTLGTGTGSCATTSTLTGGSAVGSFKCTGTSGASTIVVNLPTAVNGWVCEANDLTTTTDTMHQTASSASSCTLSGTIVASDTINFMAMGY